MDNDSAEVTSSGRSFHIRGPTTGKARLATVVNLTGGTARLLVPAEHQSTLRLCVEHGSASADRSRCRCPDREQTSLVQQECRLSTVRCSVTDADVDLTSTAQVPICIQYRPAACNCVSLIVYRYHIIKLLYIITKYHLSVLCLV